MADKGGADSVGKNVLGFAFVAFALLGVLFGMNIMAFIFGNLGPTQAGLDPASIAYNTSLAIQNNSLQALNTYSTQSDTQFSTLAIAITLVVLLAVFAFFWRFFMGSGGVAQAGKGGNFA
ncbi:MAG: hypothetical protein KAX27_06080 [Candidatus Aminicenantes bacterium]|nr:hypothetical protein [Candidatus Aminicenantes bacterium]